MRLSACAWHVSGSLPDVRPMMRGARAEVPRRTSGNRKAATDCIRPARRTRRGSPPPPGALLQHLRAEAAHPRRRRSRRAPPARSESRAMPTQRSPRRRRLRSARCVLARETLWAAGSAPSTDQGSFGMLRSVKQKGSRSACATSCARKAPPSNGPQTMAAPCGRNVSVRRSTNGSTCAKSVNSASRCSQSAP